MSTYRMIAEFAEDMELNEEQMLNILCDFIDQKDKVYPLLAQYLQSIERDYPTDN